LTKAELSDQLAEGGPPKTGNVDELIERLVSADSEQPTAVPECNDAGVGSPSPPHRRRRRRSTLMLQTVCARPATRQLRRH